MKMSTKTYGKLFNRRILTLTLHIPLNYIDLIESTKSSRDWIQSGNYIVEN